MEEYTALNRKSRAKLEFPCEGDGGTCCKNIKRCMKGCLDTAVCSCFGMKTDFCLDFACPQVGKTQLTDEKLFLKVSARLIGHGQLDAEIKLSEKEDAAYMRAFLCHTSTLVRCSYNIFAWAFLFMAVFEPPAVADVFPLWALWAFELFCLVYFIAYTFRNRNYVELSSNCDYRNTVTLVACVACLADCIGAMTLYYSGVGMSIRYSRPLRPIFIANSPFAFQLRKAITCTVKTVRDVTFAMILLMGSVLLYAVLAYRLFSPRKLRYPDGLPWFPSFGAIMWELYVLMTTANSPDVMLPIFNINPATCIFFVSYLLLNFYLFMGFVLAVVVDTYKKHMKRDVINYVLAKRRALDQAFHLVSEEMANGELFVTREKFLKLMHYLKPHYGTIQNEIVFLMLDPDEEGYVGKDKFLSLSEFLNVEIVLGIGPTNCIGQAFPRLYASRYSTIFVKLANSSFFSYAVDIFILLNVILYIANCDQVELVFLTVFSFEILLKLYGMNTRTFWQNSWNKFDVLVVLGAWAVELLDLEGEADGEHQIHMADMILVLRILRITRVMRLIPGFRNIVSTLRNIMPSLVSFGNILVLLYYLYAMVGMELFGGRIVEDGSSNCGNPKLNLTEFAIKRYCAMNFNNIGHSYLTLFTLMVVNQWHVLTDGYVAVTNNSFRLYFISFHVVAVLIILNIVNAFILEVFLLNYEAQQSDVLNAVEAKLSQLGLGYKEFPVEEALRYVDVKEFNNLQKAQDYFLCDRDASRNVWSCLEQLFAVDLKELGVRRNYSTTNMQDPPTSQKDETTPESAAESEALLKNSDPYSSGVNP